MRSVDNLLLRPHPHKEPLWNPHVLDTRYFSSGTQAPRTSSPATAWSSHPAHLVGLLMVDRPDPVDANWLATIERTFGSYELTAMTTGGERGMVCQMHIAEEGMQHLRVLPHPDIGALRDALRPLLDNVPAVTLHLAWSADHACWMSRIIEPRVPLFSLGMVVGTQGAVDALEEAGQSPQEFLDRHSHGDWGTNSKQTSTKMTFRSSTDFASSRPTPPMPANASGCSPRRIAPQRPFCFPDEY